MIIALLLAAASAAYQLLALTAALRHLAKRDPAPRALPPVSILKPVRGLDPHFREAIRSHALLDYAEYEVLFGVSDSADPALPAIRELIEAFPERRLRVVEVSTQMPNGKVGALVDLAAAARYPLLLVNDSDIRVPPDYLRRLVGPLEDPSAGLVTCLYRARSDHWPGRWEALGIATDFAPGVLAAPLVGVREFGLGATLLFRAADLEAIGGFAALGDYIADDYQLARSITRLGRRVVLSKLPVETFIEGRTWGQVWRRQVRWARTIRVSRGAYLGLPLSNATLWALVALAAGAWWAALPLAALRLLAGLLVAVAVLGDRHSARLFFLMPLRDLWALAVWLCGLTGNSVEWRGLHLRLSRDGRIGGTAA
ncbi:MAG: bacteriohopanetetrol glucosamine biosynthesis glycosyltransferase HpnI [Bryobacterales bacterium]|nr:bacteriohopanetetrol glucosamine biosynthesis glycosyltransferase HpnI [Bryobacterales bacterium]